MPYYLTQHTDYISIHSTDGAIPNDQPYKEITESEHDNYLSGQPPEYYYNGSEWVERGIWHHEAPIFQEDAEYVLTPPECTNLIIDGQNNASKTITFSEPGTYNVKVEPFPEWYPMDIICIVTEEQTKEITRRIKQLEKDCQAYIDNKVPQEARHLLSGAMLHGNLSLEKMQNTKAIFNWMNVVIQYMYGIRDQFEFGNFVAYDFEEEFNETLPEVTLRDCLPGTHDPLVQGKGDIVKIGF